LATAEVLKAGIKKIGEMDIVFSGHRASDGETGQTGPQTAWKLGYPFLGNVISYNVDTENRIVTANRLITLQGTPDVIEHVEAPLPVFMTLDPSYASVFNTVSLRLTFDRYQKEAIQRAQNYKNYLKTYSAQQLGVDSKDVGLPGSPTIVYKVEKIPKARASRRAEIIDGSDQEQLHKVAKKIFEIIG
jgi:electron transfer flavoprotein beta subunit